MIEDKYVIACDTSVGKVGDVIQFTGSNGDVTNCVVGINTISEEYKTTINFLVDRNNWTTQTPLSNIESILTNSTKIENIGSYVNKEVSNNA